VSPLLANIYLHELDGYLESKYLSLLKQERQKRRKQGRGNYLYVRYADDFVVLCNGTKAEAHAMKEELRGLLSTMGLTLSEEKTKVTHITEGFKFLGYWIERSVGTTGKMVPKVYVPREAITAFRHTIRRMTAPNTEGESVNAKLTALNNFTRGWCQYYRCTSSPSKVFHKLHHEIFWEVAHWLGRKYKSPMPGIMRRFRKERTFGTKTINLIMPDDFRAKNRLVKTWHNPYTAKEEIVREKLLIYESLWSGHEDRQGASDLREEIILLKGTVCAIQGLDCISHGRPLHPSEVEIDHIKLRIKFKDPREADRMGNLQPVCTPCHRAKTKADLKVLSRMR
jgi:RNA-directed DNA polymerase